MGGEKMGQAERSVQVREVHLLWNSWSDQCQSEERIVDVVYRSHNL